MERIKQKLEEARKLRERLQHGHATSGGDGSHRKRRIFRPENYRHFALTNRRIWILSGMAVVVASAVITWLIKPDEGPAQRLSDLDLTEPYQTSATENPAFEELKEQITGLIERLDTLTNSISHLEASAMRTDGIAHTATGADQKLTPLTLPELPVTSGAARVIETLPPPAAGEAGSETSAVNTHRQATPESTDITVNTTVSKVDIKKHQDPVSDKQPAVSADKEDRWVINIASSRSKSDANRLAEKALARDIHTKQQQVTVNGKQYWRVQVTGFSTAAEARASAGPVKEKLGLKDVWITTN